MKPRTAKERGFTLLELMVVMVIAALVLALVGTSISRSVSGAEMRTAARKVAANLRYTRTQAILQKSEQVFLVDTEARTFQAPSREPFELPEGMRVALTTARKRGRNPLLSGRGLDRRLRRAGNQRPRLQGQRCLADRRDGGGETG